ncbi:MAG: type II toxin-antitoxin system VapC family toxin [Verrucomicrobia bacterium]|nr:type II toxin-antitoxin system VapC family toxin [Verrucomicrobiota bacterium]
MSVLLDTNVLSELAQPLPAKTVIQYCRKTKAAYLSVITIHELLYGAKLVKAKTKQKKLLTWIDLIRVQYEHCILDITFEIVGRSADLRAIAGGKGCVLHIEDALIAATALEHSLDLATRNTRDFKTTGVTLIDPWKGKTK